jgi:hypothetical protein
MRGRKTKDDNNNNDNDDRNDMMMFCWIKYITGNKLRNLLSICPT